MQPSLARAAFFGLMTTSLALGALDAGALLRADLPELDAAGRVLAALYVTAPYVALGTLLAGTTGILMAVWARARPREAPDDADQDDAAEVRASSPAGLLALIFFGALYFVACFVVATRTHHRGLGGKTLSALAPTFGLAAFVLWAVLRRVLGQLDLRFTQGAKLRVSALLGAGAAAFVLSLAVATFFKNDALQETVGLWPPMAALAYPLVAAATTYLLQRFLPRGVRHPVAFRLAVLAAALATVGTGDLVRFMDARPGVKAALLGETLVFKPLAQQAQTLFDADRDGYAGLLGGGDCDDENPDVYPGAPEIPLNGLDDDCFGGDAGGAGGAATSPDSPATDAEALPRAPVVHRPNLVLITIDTLRADHLGAWGYRRATSPNLDAFAAKGLRFAWAFSQGAQTKVSMPSVFTGKYFSEVERSPDSWATIWPENHTLAEALREIGYRTAGVPAHRFFLPSYGLNQGFDEWDLTLVDKYGPRIVNVSTGGQTTDRALEWLGAHKPDEGPFYLWLHYFDPHHFYQSHDTPTDFGDQDIDRYDEEIRFMDEHLGRFLQGLTDQGWSRNTYVLIHGDHGEAFGEHDYRYHGQHLYNDQVHVPLILVGPGLPDRTIGTPVALLDVMPTLLDLAGASPPDKLSGTSLLPFGSPEAGAKRGPVFIEMVRDSNHSDRRAIVDWPWKFQWGITFNEQTLFNLETDPDERNDVVAETPEVVERLNKRLRQFMASEVHPIAPRQ